MGRLLAALALLAATACSPIVRYHGYVPPEGALAALSVGVDTPETVVAAVGRPTTEGVLGDSGLYYVQSRFEQVGPRAPREVSREVLAMTFLPDGTLGNVERFGLEEGRVVRLSTRVTAGVFADRTFITQLLGNVGRIDPTRLFGDGED